MIGSRSMTRHMPVPSLSVLVTTAAALRATKGSSVCQYSRGRLGPPGHGLLRLAGIWGCSGSQIDSKPRASSSRASSATWMAESVGNMAMPYFMRSASQVDRGVVRASGERPDLCLEIRAVELLGVRQRPGLPLEAPRFRMEGLRALEECHRRLGMDAGVKVLRETKRRGRQCVSG